MSSPPKVEPVLKQSSIPNGVKFLFGGLSGMGATIFVQPLDLVKNRMQMAGVSGKKEFKSSGHALRTIIANEGFLAVYNGLSAGLARQATYTTTRLGTYTWLFEKFSSPGQSPSFLMTMGMGMSAGAVGAFVGNPTEVALIRMTSDGRLPVDERRNYKNVFNALSRIVKEEGVLALWRGSAPTIARAIVVNAAQLSTYSNSKKYLISRNYVNEGHLCNFYAAMISGLATTTASMPADIVKTRIQNMRIINGKPEYSGVMDVFRSVVRKEGFFSLWKGFTPYYMRLGPHTTLTFMILEQLNSLYYSLVLGTKQGQKTI
ncbi:mitochondrial carrier protein [Ditylenchus destructor]|nr:mitochondrial carrier protein [Ditylenchus destructor]